MSQPTRLIQATNIQVRQRNQLILEQVSVTLDAHDFITIIGPNGAGKTTLIKCLVGIQKPTTGDIVRHPQLAVGYIPQSFSLAADIPIRVEHFINLARNNQRVSPLNQLSDLELIELMRIDKLLNKPLKHLSGGQLQRVLLARALLLRPNLLVLDEPAKSLDISSQLLFYKLLETLYQQLQLAILLVSHDLHFVMQKSQQIICLNSHICCSGKPLEVSQNPTFQSLFDEYRSAGLSVYEHDLSHHQQHD